MPTIRESSRRSSASMTSSSRISRAGTAHFRSVRIPPPAARLTIERQGDLLEAYLIERAIAALKRAQRAIET
jgi:hypothetical protein